MIMNVTNDENDVTQYRAVDSPPESVTVDAICAYIVTWQLPRTMRASCEKGGVRVVFVFM